MREFFSVFHCIHWYRLDSRVVRTHNPRVFHAKWVQYSFERIMWKERMMWVQYSFERIMWKERMMWVQYSFQRIMWKERIMWVHVPSWVFTCMYVSICSIACTYPHLHESVQLQEPSSTYVHALSLFQLCTLALYPHLHESVHVQEASSTYLLLLRASPPTGVTPPTC
jgi:hypothetical protein